MRGELRIKRFSLNFLVLAVDDDSGDARDNVDRGRTSFGLINGFSVHRTMR